MCASSLQQIGHGGLSSPPLSACGLTDHANMSSRHALKICALFQQVCALCQEGVLICWCMVAWQGTAAALPLMSNAVQTSLVLATRRSGATSAWLFPSGPLANTGYCFDELC